MYVHWSAVGASCASAFPMLGGSSMMLDKTAFWPAQVTYLKHLRYVQMTLLEAGTLLYAV